MSWTIILGYVAIVIFFYFSLSGIPIAIIGGLIANITSSDILGFLIAGIATWWGISLLWKYSFGSEMPLLAFLISAGLETFHLIVARTELYDNAKKMMITEILSIVLVASYVLMVKDFNLY